MQACPFTLTGNFNRSICGIPDASHPTRLSQDRKSWTVTALEEEVKEFKDASTLEDEVDALIDLMYFAAGRFQEMGVDGPRAFMLVHNCNMEKQRGELARRPGSMGHDAIKPPGWKPPDYSWLVKQMLAARISSVFPELKVGERVIIDIGVGTVVDIQVATTNSLESDLYTVEIDGKYYCRTRIEIGRAAAP